MVKLLKLKLLLLKSTTKIIESLINLDWQLKEINEKIVKELGNHYTSRIIGYTIVVKKWRRDMREDLKENSAEEKQF